MRKKSVFKTKKVTALLLVLVLCFTVGLVSSLSAKAAMPLYEGAEGKYMPDYASFSETEDAAHELVEKIMEEGMVMLKNDNDTLPFSGDVKRISVFGKVSENIRYTDDGIASNTYKPNVTLWDSLSEAGYSVNPTLRSFYQTYDYPGYSFEHPGIATSWTAPGVPAAKNEAFTLSITSANYKSSHVEPGGHPGAEGGVAGSFTYAANHSMGLYDDAAIIVLGGRGKHPNRGQLGGSNPSGSAYTAGLVNDPYIYESQLTQSEIDLIDYVSDNFDKVVVLTNGHTPLDAPYIKDCDGIDSVIHIDAPGGSGMRALGKILNGTVNPSGRLSNGSVNDLRYEPEWQNTVSGTHNGAVTATGGNIGIKYEEGIYIGYKYFETRGYEMALAEAIADGRTEPDDDDWSWYDSRMIYPFGHGLSYTEFEWTLVSSSPADNTVLNKDDTISVTVNVKNTGIYAGKDVVELYYTAPYTQGGIEKSFVNLAGFEKTRLLQPGQSQKLTITLAARDMASYDWNNANNNAFWGGYELEKGDYQVRLMRNANVRSQEIVLNYEVPDSGYFYDTDDTTGKPISNNFTANDPATGKAIKYSESMMTEKVVEGVTVKEYDAAKAMKNRYNTYADSMTILYRGDFNKADLETNPALSFPKPNTQAENDDAIGTVLLLETGGAPTGDTKNSTNEYINGSVYMDRTDAPWYLANNAIPATWTQAASKENRTISIMAKEMAGIDYNDAKWDTFLNQLTIEELQSLSIGQSGYGIPAVDAVGLPMGLYQDGPFALRTSHGDNPDMADVGTGHTAGILYCYPSAVAATWNKELMYEQGRMFANEAFYLGVSGLYCLTLDIRRSQYGPRVESASEDPYLTGIRGAQYVRGSQDIGVIVQVKHCFMYVEDSMSPYIWANEQALRETYLRPFELAIKKGGALGVMSSYVRIGAVASTTNYALLTATLKNEWGFKGFIVTDAQWNIQSNLGVLTGMDSIMGNSASRVYRATVWDSTLNSGRGNIRLTDGQGAESATVWKAYRETAKRNFYVAVNSNVFAIKNADNTRIKAPATWGGITLEAVTQNASVSRSLALSAEELEELTSGGSNYTVSYKLTSDTILPAGLSFNESTGALSGTLRESSANPYRIGVELYINSMYKTTQVFMLPTISAFVLGDVNMSSAISVALNKEYESTITGTDVSQWEVAYGANGAGRTTTYKLASGSLPAGLTLSSDGRIMGTPTEAGQYSFKVTALRCITTAHSQLNFQFGLVQQYSEYTIDVNMVVDNGYSEATVKGWITSMTSGFLTETQVDSIVKANKNGYLTNDTATALINSLTSGHQTAAQVDALIKAATGSFLTETEIKALITSSTSGFQNADQVNALIAAKDYLTQDEINALIASKGYVAGALTESQVKDLLSTGKFVTESDVQKMMDDLDTGCGSSIAGTSILFGIIALAAVAIVLIKSRKKSDKPDV